MQCSVLRAGKICDDLLAAVAVCTATPGLVAAGKPRLCMATGRWQVSFVNSICTSRGGTHVNHVTEQARGHGHARTCVRTRAPRCR